MPVKLYNNVLEAAEMNICMWRKGQMCVLKGECSSGCLTFRKRGCSSDVEYMVCMHEVLSSLPSFSCKGVEATVVLLGEYWYIYPKTLSHEHVFERALILFSQNILTACVFVYNSYLICEFMLFDDLKDFNLKTFSYNINRSWTFTQCF